MFLLWIACSNPQLPKESAPVLVESSPQESASVLDLDGDGYDTSVDCDDTDDTIHPHATEYCNGKDDDCDTLTDNNPLDAAAWYPDVDSDTFGDNSGLLYACHALQGYSSQGDDCDDRNPAVHPGAPEVCDTSGIDEDCDGFPNDDDPSVVDAKDWFLDRDGDGFGDPTEAREDCGFPKGYVLDDEDCDDTNADINPDALEVCDPVGIDENCNRLVDDADPDVHKTSVWYEDKDSDGYGDAVSGLAACLAPTGRILNGGDCDDSSPVIHPAATEVCDALDVDEDCDGKADDNDSNATGKQPLYEDSDGDGIGGGRLLGTACDAATNRSFDSQDCADDDATIYPGAAEVLGDGIDQNCDGVPD